MKIVGLFLYLRLGAGLIYNIIRYEIRYYRDPQQS